MQLLSYPVAKPLEASVVTVGTFDGVHLGHQQILAQLNTAAKAAGVPSVVVTFDRIPRAILSGQPVPQLYTLEEKLAKLERLGVGAVLVIPFSAQFAEISYEAFVEDVLVKQLNPSKIIIGFDHQFGKNRAGGHSQLIALGQRFGFGVEEIPAATSDSVNISSTRIREALDSGNLADALRLLGDDAYQVSGTVVKGDQLGRTIGYPTANLATDPEKRLPGVGVYCGWTALDGKDWPTMVSLGYRPTVNGTDLRFEAYLMGFSGDIYGQRLSVRLTHWLRGELKLDSLDSLIAHIQQDEIQTRTLLNL